MDAIGCPFPKPDPPLVTKTDDHIGSIFFRQNCRKTLGHGKNARAKLPCPSTLAAKIKIDFGPLKKGMSGSDRNRCRRFPDRWEEI